MLEVKNLCKAFNGREILKIFLSLYKMVKF